MINNQDTKVANFQKGSSQMSESDGLRQASLTPLVPFEY